MAFCKCFVYDKVVDPAQYKVVVYELHGAAEVFHMAFNFADGGFNGVRVPFHIPGAPVFKGYFHAGRPKFFKKFRQLPYNVRTCATGILICNVYELGSVFRVFGPFIAGQLVYFFTGKRVFHVQPPHSAFVDEESISVHHGLCQHAPLKDAQE